jgi:hypothetical protein
MASPRPERDEGGPGDGGDPSRRQDTRPDGGPAGTDRDDALERAALASERIQRHLSQGSVADVIYVQDRLINLVTR